MRRHMLKSVSSYRPQLNKHRRGLISAFEGVFSTVGRQDAYGIFNDAAKGKWWREGVTKLRYASRPRGMFLTMQEEGGEVRRRRRRKAGSSDLFMKTSGAQQARPHVWMGALER